MTLNTTTHQSQPLKATLTLVEPTGKANAAHIGTPIEFLFNPKDYSFTRKGTWSTENRRARCQNRNGRARGGLHHVGDVPRRQ